MNKLFLSIIALLASAALQAQLPVDHEPHHKIIEENHYYRLLEGKIPVNDTTPAHIHAANSVVIFLSHSTFGIRVSGKKPVIATVNPGDFKYSPYGDTPVNHIVWNQSPALFHFYVVELRKGLHVSTRPLDLTPTHPEHLPPSDSARLFIATQPPFQYRFFPPNTPADLEVTGHYIQMAIH